MDEHNTARHSVDDYYPRTDSGPELSDGAPSGQESDGSSGPSYGSGYDSDGQGWITCPNCGSRIPAASNFCNLCGHRFENGQEVPFPLPDVRIDGYLVDDIASFVAVNYQTYLTKFQKIAAGKFSFNWAAAIFSSSWMAYRGMFRPAFLLTLIAGALSTVLSFFISLLLIQANVTEISSGHMNQINMLFYCLNIGVCLICGILGDSFYWKHTRKILDRFHCRGREAVSNLKLARSLKAVGGYRIGYLGLIILFNLTYTDALTSVMLYFLNRTAGTAL